jgi:hypothetical protein
MKISLVCGKGRSLNLLSVNPLLLLPKKSALPGN